MTKERPVLMQHRVSAVLAACTLGLGAAACKQPAPRCTITQNTFVASYEFVKMIKGKKEDCGSLPGELLEVQGYYDPYSKHNKYPDPSKASFAIQPDSVAFGYLASGGTPNPADTPYAQGKFTTEHPVHDFCEAPKFNKLRVRMDAIPANNDDVCNPIPEQPAVDVTYEFSNVRVYVTADNIGTQFEGDLTYSSFGCTAQYKVRALSPNIACGAPAPVPDGGAAADDSTDDTVADAGATDAGAASGVDCGAPAPAPDPMVPDDSLCIPNPNDTAYGYYSLNPDIATVCDPDLLYCVLKKAPPSKK